MTASTLSSEPMRIDRSSIRKPGVLRLVRVEMRKMIDTRSGFWLLVTIALLSILIVGITVFAGELEERNLNSYFQATLLPVGLVLPVLGILMVTSEFSQRTTLTTFSLSPKRSQVIIAKFLAGGVYAILSIVTSVIGAALGEVLSIVIGRDGPDPWSITVGALASAALFQLIGVVIGVAFGLLLMNSPAAIVLYFLLPIAIAILGGTISALSKYVAWLDITSATGPLADATMARENWQHLGTAALLWIVLPIVLGGYRLARRELK